MLVFSGHLPTAAVSSRFPWVAFPYCSPQFPPDSASFLARLFLLFEFVDFSYYISLPSYFPILYLVRYCKQCGRGGENAVCGTGVSMYRLNIAVLMYYSPLKEHLSRSLNLLIFPNNILGHYWCELCIWRHANKLTCFI